MDLNRVQSMTDIIHNSINYSGIEREIIGTPIFNRLHRVMQSSLVYLTYPSNKTKRFEHSIGVMSLAGKLFFSSICNTEPNVLKSLLKDIKDAIKSWRETCSSEHLSLAVPRNATVKYEKDSILTIDIPNNTLYKNYLPENISNLSGDDKVAYYIAFQAVRIAGLLHDVGHMPYSHVLEHAINNLYNKVSLIPEDKRTVNHRAFLKDLYNYCDPNCPEKDEIHEEIGKICALKIYECISYSTEEKEDNFFFVATFDFACSILQSKTSDNNIYSDLHQIIAGIVDADRLDYCSRDAYCAGLRTDIINYKRFFATYSVCLLDTDSALEGEQVSPNASSRKRFCFCPNVKHVIQIEELLQRRWDIFSLINFHHRVHKHEILLEEIIVDLGLEELNDPNEIQPLKQGVLPLKIYSIWQIINLLKSNKPPEYLLIQFDDSWLDTLLKRKFFYRYEKDFMWSNTHSNDIDWNKYDELISSQRHYFSGFKRTDDFKKFDILLFSKFVEKIFGESPDESVPEEIREKLTEEFNGITDYNRFWSTYRSLFFTWMISSTTLKLIVIPEEKNELICSIQDKLNAILAKEDNVQDVIIRDCSFKLGCPTPKNELFVADRGIAKPLKNYSIIEHILKEKRNYSLPIHLYYLPKYSNSAKSPDDFVVNIEENIYPQLVEAIWSVVKQRICIISEIEKGEA